MQSRGEEESSTNETFALCSRQRQRVRSCCEGSTYRTKLVLGIEAALEHALDPIRPFFLNVWPSFRFYNVVDELLSPSNVIVWNEPGQYLPKDDGEGIDVGLQIVLLALEQLRSHVPGSECRVS